MARYTINRQSEQSRETGLGSAVRNIATVGSRVLEAALGLPGDIQSGVRGLAESGLKAIGIPESILEKNKELFPNPLPLPTSQQLKNIAPEYVQPQSETAETIGEIAQTLTRALLPPFGATSLSSVPALLGKTIIGEAGARGIKSLGGGPLAQEIGRIGSIFLGSLFGGRSQVIKSMTESYKNARNSIHNKSLPKSLRDTLKHENDQFYDKLGRTVTDDKKFLRSSAQSLDTILTQAKPSVEELWDTKIGLNHKLGSLSPKSPEFRLTSQLVQKINQTLQNYGKENKDFLNNFNKAEELFKGLQPANAVSKFLTENVNLKSLFKKPLYKLIAFSISPAKIAAGAATAVTLREATKLYDLLSRSPESRKIFGNILDAALRQNSKEVIRNTLSLEKKYNEGQRRYTINKS